MNSWIVRNYFVSDDIITPMLKIKLIENIDELKDLSEKLSKVDWVGIDTEFLREKTYYPLLCLIQIHSEIGEWCIDTIKIEDLSSFSQVICNPKIEKIFHSCRQDLEALDQRIPIAVENLYDTQLAASFCGLGDQMSYAAVVQEVTGVELAKTQTRTDWSARPLSDSQIYYAIDDVRYLVQVRQHMNDQLESMGRLSWHQQECQQILDNADHKIDPLEVWKRLKGAVKIPVENHGVAKELCVWRETKAQKRDRPREWVVPSRSVVEIATTRPKNLNDLSQVDGMTAGMVRHVGADILDILQANPPQPLAKPLWQRHLPMDNAQKQTLKIAMKTLREIAAEEKISQSILANRSDIESFVLGNRQINLLKGWRYDLAGKKIESLIPST